MNSSKLYDALNILAQFPGSFDNKSECLQQINKNVNEVINILQPERQIRTKLDSMLKITVKFNTTCLYLLNELSKNLKDETMSNLMSIQQQQKIKVLLQMIFSLGITPSLLQGVNTALKNKTIQLYMFNLENLTLIECYEQMTEIVRSLIGILSTPGLRALILNHLGDLISALLQVSFAGVLKKPVKSATNEKNDNKNRTFTMTEEWYQRFVNDRNEFGIIYKKLIEDIYKPLVIKELLILLAPTRSIENGSIIAPPNWLKKAISKQLTSYLISPGGVSVIMRAMCESNADSVDWEKAEITAMLISTVHGNLSNDEFYSRISPQIISMLNMTGPYCKIVAKCCIRNIYYYEPEICRKYIFDKLFESFLICSKPIKDNFCGTLVSEDSLSRCIDHLSKCFTPGSKESSIPITVLTRIIKIIFELYMKVSKSIYQHKSAIQDLLIHYLHEEKDIKNLTSIYNSLIFKEPHKEILNMNENLEFQFGPSGGVQVGKRQAAEVPSFPGSEFQLEYETSGDHLLDLLSHRQEYAKKLLSDLFVILLSALSDFHDRKIEIPHTNPDILNVDDLIVFLVRVSQKKMITIKLLAVLAENVHVIETIQEKPEIAFEFVKNLLESKVEDILRGEGTMNADKVDENEYFGEDFNKEDTEDLLVTLAVVDLITFNVKLNSDRWEKCKSLLNSIQIIRDNSQDSYVKYFSDMLYTRISTHGAVSGSKKPRIRPFSKENLADINSINMKMDNAADENKVNSQKPKGKKKPIVELDNTGREKSELDIALEEVCSDDVATRGHAIIQLGKLLKKTNSDALSKKEYLFTVLKCNLKHEDTYIYLSAINTLEILASVQKADKILEILCEEYTEHKKEFSEVQMKIGEVLMRITRGLGNVAPKYKALLVNTFLFGTKSPDELLRVSSLSNLGELLKILGYSIGNIIQEVFLCVKSIAATDKSDMARRAAVMVIQFLLKGISDKSFGVLEPVIRDLYRSLLHIYKTDKDDVTRLHAELSLAEINRIVKPAIDQPEKLEKRIGILGLR